MRDLKSLASACKFESCQGYMKSYSFYIDTKLTIWERASYTIEAKNKKEAISEIKRVFDNHELNIIAADDYEMIYDTAQEMTPEENGAATRELHDGSTHKMIKNNNPK